MTETKPKRFHRYAPDSGAIAWRRRCEEMLHLKFIEWRERIDAREHGSIAFAPEAK